MIQVIDQRDEYLVLRSDQSGELYGVRFVVEKGLESLLARPIAEFISGEAHEAPSQPRKELPAGKKEWRTPPPSRPKGTSDRAQNALRALREQGRPLGADEIRELIPELKPGTNVYTTMRQLEEGGFVQTTDVMAVDNGGRNVKIRKWMPAA